MEFSIREGPCFGGGADEWLLLLVGAFAVIVLVAGWRAVRTPRVGAGMGLRLGRNGSAAHHPNEKAPLP